MTKPGLPIEERFWAHVSIGGPDECWEWNGGAGKGYGSFTICLPKPRTTIRPYRFSWEMHNGPIPKGLFVCHACDNPPCVNPAHLWLGTNADNMNDKIRKGRQSRAIVVAKISRDDAERVRVMYASGMTGPAIADAVGLQSSQSVYNIINGKAWAS